MLVRSEMPADEAMIRSFITTAFLTAPHSGGNEADIVDALRNTGSLAISLVAEDDGEVIGHAAFSLVSINGHDVGKHVDHSKCLKHAPPVLNLHPHPVAVNIELMSKQRAG